MYPMIKVTALNQYLICFPLTFMNRQSVLSASFESTVLVESNMGFQVITIN